MAEFTDYVWLIGDEAAAYLDRLAIDDRPELQQLDSLRKEQSFTRARLLVEQASLRRRAITKFGDLAKRMFFTPTRLEQATDLAVARYKAARLRVAVGGAMVADYCCGIGGDLIALAEHGIAAGYDLSPIPCLFAEANYRSALSDATLLRVRIHQGNVEALTPSADGAWHLDPDRRTTGRRTTTFADYDPGPELIERWRRANPQGALKLAPATEAPAEWAASIELEWISSRRECRQLVAWFGSLATAPGQHRATALKSASPDDAAPASSSFVGQPSVRCDADDAVLEFIYDPDPSILAADLLGAIAAQHDLRSLGAGGAYLTGPQAIADPLLATFAVRDTLPLRVDAIAKHMAAHNIGQVEIKKRGVTIDPHSLRQKLKLRGNEAATLILTRIGDRQVAIVADRL